MASLTTSLALEKKRKVEEIHAANTDASNLVEFTPLGAGQEVGRSCMILKYQGKTVMFDCGIHPGFSGVNSLPYLDGNEDIDISKVDVALITHFHLDHCAAVPYLLSKTRFKGRIFMTHPTKAVYHQLIKDLARSAKGSSDEALYTEEDVDASMDRIEVVDFLQTLEVAGGIKITPYRAGHVLGAAMFMVEIAGMRALYTGDYSRVPDRHLPGADSPAVQPDLVICEATYGVSRHLPREQREAHFLQRVTDTLRGGGRVLLPVVALGRAQELLLMLEEHWEEHPELQAVPIYQASGMMRKSLKVYETYQEMLNEDIKTLFMHENPFAFQHVTHLKHAGQFDDVGPCVLMATPSGLQSGVSRDIFEAWCEDRRNTVILCDFAVQGTLAREILGGPKDILTKTGGRKKLNCSVAHISFSAHSDYDQTSSFLDEVKPPHVILVHGEKTEMIRLKNALEKAGVEKDIPRSVYTPAIMQTVKITYQPLRTVRVAGRLAEKPPRQGQAMKGMMVSGPSGSGAGAGAAPQQLLLHPDDLNTYTRLHRGRVTQRQALATDRPFSALRLALEVMFEGVEGAGTLPVSGVKHARQEQHVPQQHAQKELSGAELQGVTVGHEGSKPSAEKAQQQRQQQEQQEQKQRQQAHPAVKQEEPDQPAQGSQLQGGGQQQQQQQQISQQHEDSTGGLSQHREVTAVRVGDLVTVSHVPECPRGSHGAHVVIEWEGGRVADMVADAVVAVLLRETGDVAGRMTAADAAWQAARREGTDSAAIARAELGVVAAVVGSQFGPASVDKVNGVVNLEVMGQPVVIHVLDGVKVLGDPALCPRITKAVNRVLEAMRPLNIES